MSETDWFGHHGWISPPRSVAATRRSSFSSLQYGFRPGFPGIFLRVGFWEPDESNSRMSQTQGMTFSHKPLK